MIQLSHSLIDNNNNKILSYFVVKCESALTFHILF